jgi:hypothetical protein
MRRIQQTVEEVQHLKRETMDLQKHLQAREDRIITRMKDVFFEEIMEFVKRRSN